MMGCYCDYDPATFYEVRKIKAARKDHKCAECRRKIRAGEPYTYTTGLWEEWFGTFHTCQHCQRLRDYLTISFKCYCWAHGDGFDELRDFLDDVTYRAPEEMAGVRFRVGRLVVAIRRARKESRHEA